jgi:hypothetical protein
LRATRFLTRRRCGSQAEEAAKGGKTNRKPKGGKGKRGDDSDEVRGWPAALACFLEAPA